MINRFAIVNAILSVLLLTATTYHTWIACKMYKTSNNPVLFVKPQLKDAPYEWDKEIMKGLNECLSKNRGISKYNISKKISFDLVNDGSRPAYDIVLKYEIVTFKNKISFGIDEADVKKYYPKECERVEREKHIDYLAPHGKISFDIVFVSTYPKIEVYVLNLTSKGCSFIDKKLKISEYKNSDHIELGDPEDHRMMIGV